MEIPCSVPAPYTVLIVKKNCEYMSSTLFVGEREELDDCVVLKISTNAKFVHNCRSIYGSCSGNFKRSIFLKKNISFVSKFSFLCLLLVHVTLLKHI